MRLDAKLTPRELQIAELLAWGGARKEVADKLCISHDTVETTAGNIYKKIGIQKAPELSVWWFITRLGVPISMDPWKRRYLALLFLIMILPQEFGLYQQDCRLREGRNTELVVRAKRNNDNIKIE